MFIFILKLLCFSNIFYLLCRESTGSIPVVSAFLGVLIIVEKDHIFSLRKIWAFQRCFLWVVLLVACVGLGEKLNLTSFLLIYIYTSLVFVSMFRMRQSKRALVEFFVIIILWMFSMAMAIEFERFSSVKLLNFGVAIPLIYAFTSSVRGDRLSAIFNSLFQSVLIAGVLLVLNLKMIGIVSGQSSYNNVFILIFLCLQSLLILNKSLKLGTGLVLSVNNVGYYISILWFSLLSGADALEITFALLVMPSISQWMEYFGKYKAELQKLVSSLLILILFVWVMNLPQEKTLAGMLVILSMAFYYSKLQETQVASPKAEIIWLLKPLCGLLMLLTSYWGIS